MTENTPLAQDIREDLSRRMRRIEGQAQGVQRMIEEGRNCREVLDQLNSIRAATYGACLTLMKHYALECLHKTDEDRTPDEAVQEMMDLLLRMPH